ncbi:relaxase/mobilization nuclease domain-containing protein [Sinorhizobium fredii]|uniref:relaxase/mobilization nuclease domain-containing protein n=1 Tax=Rhizobium fredii TaxID=380 RepID=UPI0006936DFD|nr:relaxase/mobilization nuclease domain-containing protein [Sinorhizobium fredii]WOS62028.1 relaxase/mobilization nuclease domain-containing protein [Sinorhizobium fredii GR64]
MILKGSQRGNGADLAIHLSNTFGQSVEVAEVYGTVASDMLGAFAEIEAVSRGTKAKEYLYSLSISPPSPLTREQYFEAISAIEHGLGLIDQPRAVVFHVKDGREHCHVVWSRIDIENMRAIHMSHDRSRLMDLACELGRKFGLELPPGLKAWEAKQHFEKEKLESTLGEKAQAEETGITPEQRRAEITAAYEASDTPEAFRAALEQKGYILARGDQRGLVVVDRFGNPHSLTRHIKGHKPSVVKKKLASLKPEELPSVAQAKEMMRARTQAYDDAQREQNKEGELDRLAEKRRRKEQLQKERQAARHLEIQQAEQEMLTRQQSERLALHAAQKSEAEGILFRVRSAVADLIGRTPGLRSVLAPIQKMTHLDPRERHRLENDALARRHGREKLEIERHKRFEARIEKREALSREKALRREQRLAQEIRLEKERAAEQARKMENRAKQDFYDAARDDGLWKHREFDEGELSQSFNEAAELPQDDNFSDDDGESYVPDWAEEPDDDGDDDGQKLRKDRGYSYKRDDDP